MMKFLFIITTIVLVTTITQGQVTNGLVAKYSFNNGNANDEIGSNNGTVNGANLTMDRFGNNLMAYNFNGSSSSIDFGSSSDFEFGSSDFTISLWIQVDTAQFAPILLKRNDFPSYDQYSIYAGEYGSPSATAGFYYKAAPGGVGAPERVFSTSSLDAQWHHLLVKHKYDDSTSLYLDGQLLGSSFTSFPTGNFDVMGANLVAGYSNLSGTDYYYLGNLDDIRIYNRGLNQLEIDSLFNEQDPITVGIREQVSVKNILTVYPNPTTGKFSINLEKSQNNVQVEVRNVMGQLILTNNYTATSLIDLDLKYAVGVYVVTVRSDAGEAVVKIVKE